MAEIHVPAGGDLQAAFDSAVANDTILLAPGALFAGNYTLPVHDTSNPYLYVDVVTDLGASFPVAGQRITPAAAANFAKIQGIAGGAAIATEPSARYWRFVAVEFISSASGDGDVIQLGDGGSSQNNLSLVPADLELDRCYIHGAGANGGKRGVSLQSGNATIKNCYISGFFRTGQDTQAIAAWNGPGPYLIDNNYLEATTENFLVGGSNIYIANQLPTGITFSNNTVAKLPAWRGLGYNVKNLLELKTGVNVSILNNTFDYSWGGEGQSGYGWVFTVRNEEGNNNWATIQNLTASGNTVRHCGNGIQVLGLDERPGITSVEMDGLTIADNQFWDIDQDAWGGDGRAILLNNGGKNITLNHNTLLNTQSGQGISVYLIGTRQFQNLNISNNFLKQNGLCVFTDQGTAQGTPSLQNSAAGYTFAKNVLIGSQTGSYPATTLFAANVNSCGFTDVANNNYKLLPTSPFVNSATDLGPIGTRQLGITGFLPVVPGAYGYGMDTRAAYGQIGTDPIIYKVTTLLDDGLPGSLRYGVESLTVPRIIIFEKGGYFDLGDTLRLASPYCTIAGQTAPSPGVEIMRYGFEVTTHDVLMQHIAIRPGELGQGKEDNCCFIAFGTEAYNIVLGNVSATWGPDENFAADTYRHGDMNMTLWRCLSAEGLDFPASVPLSASHGVLYQSAVKKVSMIRSVMANNRERNPYAQSGTQTFNANNLIYNWFANWAFFYANFDITGNIVPVGWASTVIGNCHIVGPETVSESEPQGWRFYYNAPDGIIAPGSQIYRFDNVLINDFGDTIDTEGSDLNYNPNVAAPPFAVPTGANYINGSSVATTIPALAGTRPADRPAVDTRIMAYIGTRGGPGYISSQDEVGGFPVIGTATRSLALPANPHQLNPSGYTNMELWLHGYAAGVEGGTQPVVITGSGGIVSAVAQLAAGGTVQIPSIPGSASLITPKVLLDAAGTMTPPLPVDPNVDGAGGVIAASALLSAAGTVNFVQSGSGGILCKPAVIYGDVQRGSKKHPRPHKVRRH